MGKCIKDMTPEERRESGRKGGLKSGEIRRENATMQATLNKMLQMRLKPGKGASLDKISNVTDLQRLNLTVEEAGCLKMLEKFLKGDKCAAEWVRDTSGQKPVDNANITMEVPVYGGEEEI